MSVPGVEAEAPPPYSFVPTPQELQDIKASEIVGDTATYTYEVTTFGTNARELGSSKDFATWGTLALGVKYPHGVLQHAGSYTPPRRAGADGKLIAGKECDISASLELIPESSLPETSLHYRKHVDHLTDYSFDITVTEFGTDKAAFTGTMTTRLGTYEWYGDYSDRKKVTKELTKITIPAPEKLEGSIAELDGITPIAWKAEGNLKVGEDGAQKFGDELMNKTEIMMHALDPDTQRTLLPNLEELGQTEKEILRDNLEFFRRGAIHLLADQLKKMDQVNQKIKNAIKTKFDKYMKMLTSPADPQAGQEDPVVAYGFDRQKNADDLKQLRAQYSNVTMRCYQVGYKEYCHQWERYLKAPVYWFRTYSEYLIAPEHVGPWQISVAQRAKQPGSIPVDQEILLWGNKLSMLKSAAPSASWNDLDVDKVTGILAGQAQHALAYAQLVDDELHKNAQLLFDEIDSTEGSKEFREKLQERFTYSVDVDRAVRQEGTAVLSRLVNQNSKLAIESRQYWENRLPPGAAGGNGGRMTVAQIITSWEDEARLRDLRAADNFPPMDEGPRRSLFDKFKSGAKKVLSVFKSVMHIVAFSQLISQLATEGSKLNAVEMTRTICALASECINAIGIASRKLLNWLWNKGYVFKRAIGWFNDALKTGLNTIGKRIANALAGSIGKVIRLVGLVGCICGIIASYWDMQKAEAMNKNDREAFLWYSRVTFALNCLEGLIIVTGMVAEIFGWVSCATVCGPIGIVVGVLAVVVAIVYFAAFAPDPLGDIKKFLRGEGQSVGSYDISKEE